MGNLDAASHDELHRDNCHHVRFLEAVPRAHLNNLDVLGQICEHGKLADVTSLGREGTERYGVVSFNNWLAITLFFSR